ncbi:ATP-binding cassette domain-containing protein [Bacteriovoracaceae bacterium]|nr:ATP-binding cassette domain-containing protein [Bacteriovoracaceae bacterium]
MISTSNVSLGFGGRKLFDEVNIKFTPGNCYGLIGANGAGKSTFIKILSGEIESQTGDVIMNPGERLSVLRQDHFKYDDHEVLATVLMGNDQLYKIMQEKDAIYANPDFTEADGIRAAELEADFADLNGWEAESEAGILLAGLGIPASYQNKMMKDLTGPEKIKVLLAQALIGKPDVLLLDEPTNGLDIKAIVWLENFLLNFDRTVIVVSHDRHFLNKVCTHIADIDFGKITVYAGNYDFWRKSSELALKLRSDQNKKNEDKIKELKTFVQRFSANASKSSQATSRQKQIEKLEIKDLPITTRKYPFVLFKPNREVGKEILKVKNLSKTIDGEKILEDISFTFNKGEKIILLGENDLAKSVLMKILNGEMEPDSGTFEWGTTITKSFMPKDNSEYFMDGKYNLVDWLRQYSEDKDENFIRGFLGKMIFSGEEALKKTNVLSGGEKVRCMISRMMLSGANFLMIDGATEHLDLETITSFNEGLTNFNGCLLFTTHDHEFIQTVANRIIQVDGKMVYDKTGTYDEYLAEKVLQ